MRKMKDSGIEWIGEIPEYWECTQFKTLLSRNDGGVWGNDPTDTDVDKIVIRSTEQTIDGKWCINNPAKRDLTTENIKDYRIVKNDLLMTKSSGSLDHIGKTSIADEYFTKNECYYSNFIQRLRCYENKYFPKYAWFILNSTIARKQFAYLQNSTSGLGNINSGIINQIKVPLPPLPDQQRIANFLDEKVSQIDSTISKTRESIEEYKKLKQAIITEAVTKGLNPNAKMKNSGIEWIGEIPSEWEVKPIKALFSFGKGLPITKDNLTETGLSVISYGQIHSKNNISTEIRNELIRYVDKIYYETNPQSLVHKGDFIFADTSEDLTGCGNFVYVNREEDLFAGYHTIILFSKEKNDNKYLAYLFQTDCWRRQIRCCCSGVKLFSISRRILGSTNLILPSILEQQQIADFLDKKCSEIDNLITKKEQLVVELEAYKKSLIYEVVTGKKEI